MGAFQNLTTMASSFIQTSGEAKWLVNDSIFEASAFENLATGHGINRCSGFVAGEGKQQKKMLLDVRCWFH